MADEKPDIFKRSKNHGKRGAMRVMRVPIFVKWNQKIILLHDEKIFDITFHFADQSCNGGTGSQRR